MDSVVVLQARTSSTRLPAKVLLPISGVPLAILAAKRAGNMGKNVLLVTSTEREDDALVEMAEAFDVRTFRGSLSDTLKRIVDALSKYCDDTLVFRLTADNIFPDGLLLSQMEQDFLNRSVEYLSCNGEPSGLPYGVSVELTRLRSLREAALRCSSKEDREHVTPYIRRTFGVNYFEKYKELGAGHFRATIDCIDDYIRIERLLSHVEDPVNISFLDLTSKLKYTKYHPIGLRAVPKLVFGTAQLGFNYGVTNRNGPPDLNTSERLLKEAISSGMTHFDTARAYGNSEEVIGAALGPGWRDRVSVITKLSPLVACPPAAGKSTVSAFVDASVFESCARLRCKSLDVLMLHRVDHLDAWGGAVWSRLRQHHSNGLINKLGVSVQDPNELMKALAVPSITHIQMPFNIIDSRWDGVIPEIRKMKAARELIVHVRSGLLQGLLTTADVHLWRKAHVKKPNVIIDWLKRMCVHTGKRDAVELCISYLNSLEWIDGVVVGMETFEQLVHNIHSFCGGLISDEHIEVIELSRPCLGEDTLNPTNWQKA